MRVDGPNKQTWIVEINPYGEKNVQRWKAKVDIGAEWNTTGVKEIKERIGKNGLREWRRVMEMKCTYRRYKSKGEIKAKMVCK